MQGNWGKKQTNASLNKHYSHYLQRGMLQHCFCKEQSYKNTNKTLKRAVWQRFTLFVLKVAYFIRQIACSLPIFLCFKNENKYLLNSLQQMSFLGVVILSLACTVVNACSRTGVTVNAAVKAPVYLTMLSSSRGYLVSRNTSTGMMSLSCSRRHSRLLSASCKTQLKLVQTRNRA